MRKTFTTITKLERTQDVLMNGYPPKQTQLSSNVEFRTRKYKERTNSSNKNNQALQLKITFLIFENDGEVISYH